MRQRPFDNWYLSRSYETYLIHWTGLFDRHCRTNAIRYALFGGGAVSAYVGHLVRKLHDIDVLVEPGAMLECAHFLGTHGFVEVKSKKAVKAGFKKFALSDHLYEVVIALFPGAFMMLDVDDPALEVLDRYDFASALAHPERFTIHATGCDASADANVVPFEDLLISRLWPTFEPSTVHDLILLLASDRAARFDGRYFEEQLQQNQILRELALRTFEIFLGSYKRTAWYRLSANSSRCTDIAEAIHHRLLSATAAR